jgi:uncharacterized membrane protein YedE/YeeE
MNSGLMILFSGIPIGILFGFLLVKSRVFDPSVIFNQFRLKDWTMMKVFLTAIATGLVIYSILFSAGFERLIWKVTILHTDIIGGLLLGVGVAMAGACPGTVFAQLGAGHRQAIFTFLGGIVGSLLYSFLKPYTVNLWNLWPNEVVTVDALLGLSFGYTALLMFSCIILLKIQLLI